MRGAATTQKLGRTEPAQWEGEPRHHQTPGLWRETVQGTQASQEEHYPHQ